MPLPRRFPARRHRLDQAGDREHHCLESLARHRRRNGTLKSVSSIWLTGRGLALPPYLPLLAGQARTPTDSSG